MEKSEAFGEPKNCCNYPTILSVVISYIYASNRIMLTEWQTAEILIRLLLLTVCPDLSAGEQVRRVFDYN